MQQNTIVQFSPDPQNSDERSTSLMLELQKLFKKMKQIEGTTEGITQSLHISNVWEQQDAVEYFQKILKAIGPHVSKAFKGKMSNNISCSNNHIFQEKCDFYTIPFPIESVHNGVFDVEKGLQMFFKSCMLDEDNWLYCDDCHQKTETETRNEIEEFPTILSLYPKRFYFDYSQWRPVKNQCPIYVPQKLKICNIKYRLYAFINHSGTENGGHYNAIIKSFDDGKWYCFNDSYVKEDSEHYFEHMKDGFISEEAYLLMYRKMDGPDPNEKSTSELQLLCQEYCELVDKLLEWIHKYISVFEEIKGTTHNKEIESVCHEFQQEVPAMGTQIIHSKHNYNVFKDALQSGQISIPPGYNPIDVEKEWHQLHKAICKQDNYEWAFFSEHYLCYIKDLLALVEKNQGFIQTSEWAADLPFIQSQLGSHYRFCRYISELKHNIGHAQAVKGHLTPDMKHAYRDYLAQLDVQYNKLVRSSDARLQNLMKLNTFTKAATKELMWISDRREEEIKYDWSDDNTNMTAKKDNFSVLMWYLEQRKESMNTVQATGNKLLKEGHPAQRGIKALMTDLQTQWMGLWQLCCCIETHLKENTAYFQFFADVKKADEKIKNIQQTIKKRYMCDHSTTVTRLKHLLENAVDDKEELLIFRTHLDDLIERSKNIVQLKPRNPATPIMDKLLIEAACDCKQRKILLHRGDKCMLLNNSQPFMWKVEKNKSKHMVPSVYFIISPPNMEAIERSSGLDASWQELMTYWEKLQVDIKSLLSKKDIEAFKRINPSNHHKIMFTSQDYNKSPKNFEGSLRKDAETMYNNAIQHCNNQLQTVNQGEQDEPEPGSTTLDRNEDASFDGDVDACRGIGGSFSSAPAFTASLAPEEEGEKAKEDMRKKAERPDIYPQLQGIKNDQEMMDKSQQEQEALQSQNKTGMRKKIPQLHREKKETSKAEAKCHQVREIAPEVYQYTKAVQEEEVYISKPVKEETKKKWKAKKTNSEQEAVEQGQKTAVDPLKQQTEEPKAKKLAEYPAKTEECNENESTLFLQNTDESEHQKQATEAVGGYIKTETSRSLSADVKGFIDPITEKTVLPGNTSGFQSHSSSSTSSYPKDSVPSIITTADWTTELGPIAGILLPDTLKKLSVTEAIHQKLVESLTGQRLLEAQVCTGGIIDPHTGERFTVVDAIKKGLVDKTREIRLQRVENAFQGIENKTSKTKMSVAQALTERWLCYDDGLYFVQIQYLTGGLIEPDVSGRLSLEDAVRKGILDKGTAQKLKDFSRYPKCLTCPKTRLNISYKEALKRSQIEKVTGLHFLEASSQPNVIVLNDPIFPLISANGSPSSE
ncbi:uncharacterized protein Hap1MRO34_017405 isoform 2-T2 [Clarias gariepinus]|uniref:plectin isoform X2 n=1 Tax=Clarias gariepinus TaxID=13013 RepID=UPI00234D53E7|nr:plectin isoform X2 [Clarias gariepinus]